MECKNHNFVYAKQQKSNGDWMLKMQCFECGQHSGKTYKFELIGGKNNLISVPIFDEEKLRQFYDGQIMERNKIYQSELDEKRKEYYAYLQTDKWRNKRGKVLSRDNNTCQACLTNKASDVHHLTYKHIYNEPLFDLVAICRPCHEKIHQLDSE